MEFLLVRHGETDWNREHRVQGHSDVPLNASGRAQARALAHELAGTALAGIYSSDLVRARATAEAVAAGRTLQVVLDPDLREKSFGSWEGLTDAEIADRFPAALRGHWGDDETTEAVSRRALAAIARIRAAHDTGSVLVVTHGGTLRAILSDAGVEHGPIGNCDVFRLER